MAVVHLPQQCLIPEGGKRISVGQYLSNLGHGKGLHWSLLVSSSVHKGNNGTWKRVHTELEMVFTLKREGQNWKHVSVIRAEILEPVTVMQAAVVCRV